MTRWFAVLVLLAVPLLAEFVPGRFLVELGEAPAISKAPGRLAAVRSQQARAAAAIEDSGAVVLDSIESVANILVVEADEATAAQLAAIPGVRRVRPVRLFDRLLDRAVVLQRVTDAWQLVGGANNAGRGMKIAIVDTGIDVTHPGMQDGSLSTPDGFPRAEPASELVQTNSKVIVARQYSRTAGASARDTEGHGTGVAMIAAGNTAAGPVGTITGIAPKAWLGNYKVFPGAGAGAPEDAILRALDDALNDGMDVVNLSLGSFPAERLAEDTLAEAVERLSAAGVIVVVAAGNDGPEAATVASPATAPSALAVGNSLNDRIFATTVRVDDAPPYLSVPGDGPNGTQPAIGPLRDVADVDPTGLACGELAPDSLRGQIALILRGVCLFEEKLRNAERAGATAAIVYTHAQDPAASGMAVGAARLPAVMISHADGLDLKQRIAAAPGLRGTVNFTPGPLSADPARVSASSSRGPSLDAALKPELLAIGSSVYTATAGSETARFRSGTGTSFSAPMIAGAAAVLKAARPGLTNAQYRSLLINSTSAFPAPIMHTGAGFLNLQAAVRSTIAVNPQVLGLGATNATGLISRPLSITNLGSSQDTFTISVQPVAGSAAPEPSTTALDIAPGASVDLQINFTPAGPDREFSGFLLIRNSTGDMEARVPYWFAVPSGRAVAITVIDANRTAANSPGSRQLFLIRGTETTGISVEELPAVTVAEGDGTIVGVQRADFYPGFSLLEVRLGPAAGTNIFEVQLAGTSRRITVQAQ